MFDDKMLIDLQSTLSSNGILISFSGRFSQGIIEELGEAIMQHMEAENRPRNAIYNVFAIFVETTNNIKKYANSKLGGESYNRIYNSGIVTISSGEEGYFISSGNLIEKADADKLANQLDSLIALDKDQLKKRYKEQIKKELPPDSSGAGLGLIDIARKASKPIKYSIRDMQDLSFFTLTVMV
ncbi:hypothetical protein Desor_5373 [Desulfosporosinus orientis DSM 765]|uniref:Uncharacterized protein n=1 Tax=Desulfosporosinus orientis (strain ATCC 19365 / DSM 765 / NCIMB 8382 / VKM B-1628 / Singapore I) TaxID=768706 RepID=G7WED6_DESOD|nr:SiaB family protein kinase [Desulfosporosinus orientis]AET70749.1 hypothetical protein Desor_5373 [Desulfosporosinus orientis DSM 765]